MVTLRELLTTKAVAAEPGFDATALSEIPPGFRQGRGAWGGLIVGSFVDAAVNFIDHPEFSPRSLTSHLLGPVPAGPVTISVTMLRRGSNTATVSALMVAREADREGQATGDPVVVADAVVVFGSARAADIDFTASRWQPQPPPGALERGWRSVDVVGMPPGVAPEFLSQLVCRPVAGFPFSGIDSSETTGWVSPAEGVAADAVVLAALADAWWPASLVPIEGLRPAATLAFSLDIIGLPSTDEPLLHCGRVIAASEGYVAEVRELWSPDGRLLTLNQQTMVIIR